MRNMNYLVLILTFSYLGLSAQNVKRARDLGIPFEGTTGEFNNITDVEGVEVGYTTLIEGDGELIVGEGPIRTGVTVILPLGKKEGEYQQVFFH